MIFDLAESQRKAGERLTRSSARRRRSDAGRLRLPPAAVAALAAAARGVERPAMADLARRVARACARAGVRPPCRASLYSALARLPGHRYAVATLPSAAAAALHNLAANSRVPGAQLAIACFNHGSLAAVSFASDLPWLDLYQAARRRGLRPRGRALLAAALAARGLA